MDKPASEPEGALNSAVGYARAYCWSSYSSHVLG